MKFVVIIVFLENIFPNQNRVARTPPACVRVVVSIGPFYSYKVFVFMQSYKHLQVFICFQCETSTQVINPTSISLYKQ